MQMSPLPHHQTSSTKTPYTMSSSASITPQVEPSMTIKTKSSFSEIEQLVDPHHTSKNYSYGTSQLQLNKLTEPFVSPLTETNLNYHKSTFPPSREAKQRYVDSFIQNQRVLLEQELDLQRRTKAEIQSMIPLDTKSIDEELVRDDQHHLRNGFSRSLAQSPRSRMSSSTSLGTPQRRHSTLVQHRFSSHHDEQDLAPLDTAENEQQSTPQMDNDTKIQPSSSSKKPWMKALTRWILPGQAKKEDGDECNDNGQQQQQQSVTTVAAEVASSRVQQENETLRADVDPSLSSTSAAATASAPASTSTPTPVPASVSASVSAPTSAPAPAPTSTPAPVSVPVSATEASQFHDPYRQTNQRQARRAARHVSWSGGTSFERYKQQKSSMIEEGLYGLSNANIARALGSSQQGSRAPLLFLPPRNTTTSSSNTNYAMSLEATTPEPATTPAPTPELHDTPDSHTLSSISTNQKKDPAISFVQQTLSSAKSLLRPRKSIRKKSNHVDPQETRQPPTINSNSNNDDGGGGGGGGGITLTDSQEDTIHQQQQQQQQQQEKERRRRSTLGAGRYSPSLSALKEEEWVGMPGSCQNLVAFRYPKMVRIKDLRDAAIHILSTSDADDDDDDGDDDDDDNEMDYMAMTGYSCRNGARGSLSQNKPKWKTAHSDRYDDDGDHDDYHADDLNRCAKKYRNSMKRLSDPGAGLSPPPFSIGRPISSIYN